MNGPSPEAPPRPAAGAELPLIVPILVSLGRTLGRHGRHQEASDALRRALAEPEEKPVGEVLLALVDALLAAGDRDEAVRVVLEQGRTLPGAVVRALPRLTRLLRPSVLRPNADLLAAEGWSAVIGDPATQPATRRALLAFLVRARLALDDPAAGAALLEAAGDLVEGDQELLVLRSDCLLGVRDLDAAVRSLMRADAVPGDFAAGIRLRLATLYEQLGRPEDALPLLDAAEAAGDHSEAPHALRALVLLQLHDLDGARAAFQAAQVQVPDSVATTRAGACVHLAAHDYTSATDTADAGLKRHPGHSGLSFLRFQALVEKGEDTTDIERRLARFVHRMPAPTLQEYAERSARVRNPGDPAVHYFTGVLSQALQRPAEALRSIDTALALLADPAPAEPAPLELPARRLRAQILQPLLPGEAAAEYERAGQLAYDLAQRESAAQLLDTADGLGELSQVSRWALADALQLTCSVPAAPVTVDRQRLQHALAVWDEAMRRSLPDANDAWPYLTRAQISLHYARIEPDSLPRVAEAAVWTQCYDALSESTEDSVDTFTSILALLGLYGLGRDVVWSMARTAVAPNRYVPDGDRLATAAANAGDLELVAEGVRRIDPGAEPALFGLTLARLEIMRGDGPAAIAALDAVPAEDHDEFYVWWRTLAEGLTGDRDALSATLRRATAATAWEGIAVWLRLLGGEPQLALQVLAGLGDEQSWSVDVAFERALCRLADGAGDGSDDEAVAIRRTRTCRSFEDLRHLPVLAGILAWRYPHAEAAFGRIADLAEARLSDGPWPLDADADLAHLDALAGSGYDQWATTAAGALRARVAMSRAAWSDAVAAYRWLIGRLDQFPEAEAGLAWVLAEVRAADTDPAAVVDAIGDAVGDLRRHDSRRAGDFLIELTLGDAHHEAGRPDRAAALYQLVADRPGPPRTRALAVIRLHLLAVEQGRAEAAALLDAALEAFRADSTSPWFDAAAEVNGLIPSAGAWRPVVAAWAPRAGQAWGDRGLLHMAGRFYLAHQLAREGSGAEAEAEYRAVLETGRRALGPEDQNVLTTWHNLAATIADQGRSEEAAAEFRDLLAVQRRVLGDDAVLTLESWARLGQQLAASGHWEEAEAELRDVVAAYRRTSGDESAETVAARYELAWVWYNRGEAAAAEAEYRAVADVRSRTLPPDDPKTLAARSERCLALAALGNLDEAATELRAVADARMRSSGADGDATLTARKQLADVLLAAGDTDAAEEQFRAVSLGRQRTLGLEHPATMVARRDFCGALAAAGRWEAAATELRALLPQWRKGFGDADPVTVDMWWGLSVILFNAGAPEEADAELRELIRIQQGLLTEDDPQVLELRSRRAELLFAAGLADPAIAEQSMVVAALARTAGDDAELTSDARSRLAAMRQGDET